MLLQNRNANFIYTPKTRVSSEMCNYQSHNAVTACTQLQLAIYNMVNYRHTQVVHIHEQENYKRDSSKQVIWGDTRRHFGKSPIIHA